MKIEYLNIRSRTIALFITLLILFSCSKKDEKFIGKYELNRSSKEILSRNYDCLLEFQKGGKGYLSCDGPIQISWLVVENDVILIESRRFNLIFDPIEYDTNWSGLNVIKWQSRSDSNVTLKHMK